MDTGDVIALCAVVVSVGAAGVSIHQAKTAKDSAKHAREQAEAAKEANALTRLQLEREEAREQRIVAQADAASLREAEKVELGFRGGGGSVTVSVTNNGIASITDVELLDVRAGSTEEGPWAGWSVNRSIVSRAPQAQTRRTIVQPGETMKVACWLLDSEGQQVRSLPQACEALVRFRDAGGQWWHVTAGEQPPTRVDPPGE